MGKYLGIDLTEKEHEKWHKENYEMRVEQDIALMKRMGVSEEEDKEWHKNKKITENPSIMLSERKYINPFAVGGRFLEYCVKQGWLMKEGKGRSAKYFVTEVGKKENKKFGIYI